VVSDLGRIVGLAVAKQQQRAVGVAHRLTVDVASGSGAISGPTR
jgi:hypothetical protein